MSTSLSSIEVVRAGTALRVGLADGTRVRIEPVPPPAEKPKTFGDYFAEFCGVITDAPADLASQHEHYRLGTPKR